MGLRWCIIVVFISLSLTTSDAEHYIYIHPHPPYLVKGGCLMNEVQTHSITKHSIHSISIYN